MVLSDANPNGAGKRGSIELLYPNGVRILLPQGMHGRGGADELRKSVWRVMGRMVCQLGGSLKYRVYSRPVDMRKSFRGLAGIVHSEIGRQLSPEDVYVFVGKNRRTLKLLHREGHGLTLYTRKLDGVEESKYNTNVEGVQGEDPVS